MTKDKFRALCEQVLVPRIGDLLHARLATLDESLELLAAEMVRMGERFERLIVQIARAGSEKE